MQTQPEGSNGMQQTELAEEPAPPQASLARRKARVLRNRLDNLEVRRARIMMKQLRSSSVDVLAIGDSTWTFTAPYDEDKRHLAAMITHGLGSTITMHGVVGAGYNANLIDAYLGLAQRGGFRPVVIVPLSVRLVTVAWAMHPSYTHAAAASALRGMPGDIPLWRIRKAVRRPSAADFAAYDDLTITAFGETAPIRDFRQRLKQPERYGLDREGREKLLYAFHHGERVDPDGPFLPAIRQLGRRIASMGCPVVAYETAIPVMRGEELHGSEFRVRAEENQELLRQAFREGLGGPGEILQTGMIFPTEEFIDPEDGSEHINAKGRLRLTELIVDATVRAL
jgi:hypothetical protein